MSAEYLYKPYKPDPDLVIARLKSACTIAETTDGAIGKRMIFSALRIDPDTNEMTPLQFTINVGYSSEVQFAKNLANVLLDRKKDKNFTGRYDRLLEWMGGLG